MDAANNALPNFAWIALNNYYEGEAAWFENYNVTFSLQVQDEFLQMALEPLLNSSAWADSRSLLVVTWDESDGWGWPDNHIPTALVASQPGMLKDGKIIDAHYDGYGILRTIEAALQLDGFGRFDEYSNPMNEIVESAPVVSSPVLIGSPLASTAGQTVDTFGQVATPVSVVQGSPLNLFVKGTVSPQAVVVLNDLVSTPNARYYS